MTITSRGSSGNEDWRKVKRNYSAAERRRTALDSGEPSFSLPRKRKMHGKKLSLITHDPAWGLTVTRNVDRKVGFRATRRLAVCPNSVCRATACNSATASAGSEDSLAGTVYDCSSSKVACFFKRTCICLACPRYSSLTNTRCDPSG